MLVCMEETGSCCVQFLSFFDMAAFQELLGFLFSIFRCGYCILTATCGKPRTFAVNFI